MYDVELVLEILRQIHEAGKRIERRFSPVRHPNDFLANDEGLDRLDAICMMLTGGFFINGSSCPMSGVDPKFPIQTN